MMRDGDKRGDPPPEFDGKIVFNRTSKFDMQIKRALWEEERLARVFTEGTFDKLEVKGESYKWERSGNICVEFASYGKPTGIAVTEATHWVHELKRNGATVGYFIMPMDRFKEIARFCLAEGRVNHNSGDNKNTSVVLIPIRYLWEL